MSFRFLFVTILACFSSFSFAFATDAICHRTTQDIQKLLQEPAYRLAFPNNGGLANGGVCWWHSRLQRAVIHLTKFQPSAPKPSHEAAAEIIRTLIHFRSVVTIPGYENFNSFSHDHQLEIQRQLNEWQIRDGFINQRWIRGLSGQSSMKPNKLSAHMDQVFDAFSNEGPGLFIMYQIPGITAHAALIVDMTPISNGYQLLIVESNNPELTRMLYYHEGDTRLRQDDYTFVPYAAFSKDLNKIEKAIEAYCGG